MRAIILSAGLVCVSMPAMAGSTYKSECYRDWGRLVCEAERKSPSGTTNSECIRENGRIECTASHKPAPRAEPERPVRPPSATVTPTGVVVIRGMSR